MNSDQIVESLQPFGVIGIFQSDTDKGFRAKASLFMHGMKAECASEFGHPTMLSALQELQERVYKVVNVGDEVSGRLAAPAKELIK